MADKKTSAKAVEPKKRGRFGKFFRDTRSEFKKISWPSKKQVWNNTVVVIVTVLVFGAVIWGLDYVLGLLRSLMMGWFS